MIAQGSVIVNLEFFEALNRRLDSIQTCAELQEFTAETLDSLLASLGGINQQLAAIGPILALLTAPTTDPTKIVTWIKDFIAAFLAPYVKPYVTSAAQLAALMAAITQLTAKLQAKAGELDSCSITLPELPAMPALPPMPPLPAPPGWP